MQKNISHGILLFILDRHNALIRTTESDWLVLLINSVPFALSVNSSEDDNTLCDGWSGALRIDPKDGNVNYVCIEPMKTVLPCWSLKKNQAEKLL